MDRLDALEIKLTWEEAQDMLRPPLSVMPSIITIEDHVFEEYEVSHFADVVDQCVVHYSPSFTWCIYLFLYRRAFGF